jgi:hypothetical protein
MGTYLQGVQSIIPSIQPHDNGLNMVANVLQLKQNQYDTNYKSLNKMYGQFYYADLTRDDNIQKRDNTVQQIDFDLKRIAGLDLSSEQNVQQAMQIFKPFYEDGALMKDMAWTKNFNNTLGSAQGLLKSDDVKMKGQYWDDGIKELQYKREEFKNASAEEAMGMANPIYTPYVNVKAQAEKLAKDSGLSFEKTSLSDNQKWIIKKKNGELLIEPLANLFESQLGSDPAVQAVYKTQAYVNRKDFAYGEANKYGGVKEAEMKYLEDGYGKLKDLAEKRHADKQSNSQVYAKQIENIESQIKQHGSDPLLEKELAQYKQAKETNDALLDKLGNQVEQFNSAYSSSGNTSTGKFTNPYQDIDQLRRVVDGSMADNLMNEDIMDAASSLAYRDAKEDFKENPYAVLDVKHAQQMSEINQAGSWRYKTEQLRGQNALNKIQAQAYYDEYSYSGAEKGSGKKGSGKSGSGKKVSDQDVAKANETVNNPYATQEEKVKALATLKKAEESNGTGSSFKSFDPKQSVDKQNLANIEKSAITNQYHENAKGAVIDLLKTYEQAMKNGNMSKKQFFDLVKPKHAKMLTEEEKKHPAYTDYLEEDRLYTSPSALRKKIEKEGVEFLLANTNMKTAEMYDVDKSEKENIAWNKKSQKKLQFSKADEDNYLKSLITKGAEWTTKNSELTEVKSARVQGLDDKLTKANLITKNMQDVKSWRYKTRNAIVDDMYNDLKDDENMKLDFGTQKFDRNGKFIGYDMSNLKTELNNMFDASGNIDKDYRPRTNYGRDIAQYNRLRSGTKNAPFAFGNPDEYQSEKNAFGVEINPEVIRNKGSEFITHNMDKGTGYLTEQNPYRYEQSTARNAGKDLVMYGSQGSDPTTYYKKLTGEDVSAKFASQFAKSARNIYMDLDDKHVVSQFKLPFYDQVASGGTGITSTGLQTLVDLSKPNSDASVAFWQFGKDWQNMRSKVDGDKRVISFEGANLTGYNSGKVDKDTELSKSSTGIGKRLLDDYFNWTKKHDTEANAFNISAQRIAAQNVNMGAMTINLPEKFLKEYLKDEKKNPNGYLDDDTYKKLTENGLSIISPNNDFSNILHNSLVSPLQAHVDYNDEYVWNHPSGLGTFKIRKGDENEPDYVTEMIYKDYDGKQVGSSIINNSTIFGPNLENALEGGISDLNEWVYTDLKMFNQQRQNIQMQNSNNQGQ